MTKGAAFFYAVAVGAAANFVIDYIHHHEDVTPVVAHETITAHAPEHTAIAPIVHTEPRVAEPRVPERPTTASLPPVREITPLPVPATPVALPQVPTLPVPKASAVTALPQSADLPTPPLKPTSVPSLGAAPAVAVAEPPADRPSFSVPAAASALPPVDKSADKPVEAMSTPALGPSIGDPVSLLPPPDKPEPPKNVKPGSGTGGLY
jgi:hypothetical protein